MNVSNRNNTRSNSKPAFEFRQSLLGRILGFNDLIRISLNDNKLMVKRLFGKPLVLNRFDVWAPIRCENRSGFTTIWFTNKRGQTTSVRGLWKADFDLIKRTLEDWIAPAQEQFLNKYDKQLTEIETDVKQFLGAKRFIKKSQMGVVSQRLIEDLGSAATVLKVPPGQKLFGTRISALKSIQETLESRVAEANEAFVELAISRHAELFDTVESNPLTTAQRRACVIDDDHNLVLAGAGTGKTSVMIGRLGYLLAERIAKPHSVLLLAFNRDAAEELRNRAATRLSNEVSVDDMTIKTFHALGSELVGEKIGKKPSLSPLAGDKRALSDFVDELLEELLEVDEFAECFIEFGFRWFDPHQPISECVDIEEYEKNLERAQRRTLNGELVKSYQEVQIANFLLKKGIKYAYEEPYPLGTATKFHRQYKPDFTLKVPNDELIEKVPNDELVKDEQIVILEHFGIDRNGQPPAFFGEEGARKYLEGMEWKRELCKKHDLPLIETYSYEFDSDAVFNNLERKLIEQGLMPIQRSKQELLGVLRERGKVNEAAQLFADLIPLIRESNLDGSEIDARISSMPKHQRKRSRVLWKLLTPILGRYELLLAKEREIDFSDMIRSAIDYLNSGQFKSPFSHILVDEFQDISKSRAELVLALAKASPNTTVFCVGDDWQSIYRFAGSDIRYTNDFEKLVGPGTTCALDRTFRFNNEIGEFASTFVGHNPDQIKKNISSQKLVQKPAVSLVPTAEPSVGLSVVLGQINRWAGLKDTRYSVYVLARYHYEFDSLRQTVRGWQSEFPDISELTFSTVHGAKGLEADFVVIVGLGQGRNGFPADKPLDEFNELFLPPLEAFPFAEERRLFYVAVTRAKHRVYLLYDQVSHSQFVHETRWGGYRICLSEFSGDFIQAEFPNVSCPRCETGNIVPKTGPHGHFFGCRRFPICQYLERGCGTCGGLLLRGGDYCVCSNEGCDGVHPECPRCGAPMVHRNGPHGAFFGCSNFGRLDVIEQCSETKKWHELPAADQLRRNFSSSLK